MATTYDYIGANKRRSALLIVVFVAFLVFFGWLIDYLFQYGSVGIVYAVIIAVGMSLFGYYSGDQVALRVSGARGPVTKEQLPYLYNMVENLCITVGLPMPKLYLIEDENINAFATGRDPQHASIAVTNGAINRLENEELEGVLAHELSHVKNFDTRYMTLVTILVGIVALLADYARRAMWFGGGRRRSSNNSEGAGIFAIIGLILIIFAPIIAQLIKLAVSRKREFLADASAALMTRYPEGLARALEKIDQANIRPMAHTNNAVAPLYISSPFGRSNLSNLLSTHPPIAKRVEALRKMGSGR